MMEKRMSVHDKATRLVEGGIVDVDGHCVKLSYALDEYDPCLECEMDCLCFKGVEMEAVCSECDSITRRGCYLCLVESNNDK